MKLEAVFIPLRWVLPALLALFILFVNLYSNWYSIPHAQRQVEQEVQSYFSETLNRIHGAVRYQFQRQNKDGVVREISNLGGLEGFRLVVLFDEQGRVIASNRFSHVGRHLDELLPELRQADFARLRQPRDVQMSNKTWSADRRFLIGYYPVPVGSSGKGLYSDRIGLIYVEFDASLRKQRVESFILEQSTGLSTFTTILLVILLLLMHFGVTRRAARLVESARRVSSGDLKRGSGLHGRDELAMIGRAFDEMVVRLHHERELIKEGENRLRAILDNVLDGIITINERGEIENFNKAAEAIFGYAAGEVAGQNVKILMPEPYHSEHDGYLHNFVSTGKKKIIGIGRQVIGQRKDGSTFPMDLAVTEMWLGDTRMFTGIVRDITERVKVERMKSEFISTVSHELRTPLTSIRGSLALIVGGVAGELPAKVKPLVDIAHKNSERLILLVNDILDMEKIEAGKMEFDLQPVELMPLLTQALEGNRAYAEQYKVSYELEGELPGVRVKVDANRLMQVFANLLSNAAKFSPAGEKVAISVVRQDHRIRVTVKNRGPGIPDEFKGRIFQKFAQADSSDTRKKGGTGLGLSITKAIVEQMGGSIGFDSHPDVLTEFYFEFNEWLERLPEIECVCDASTPRMLVCEDNRDNASVLRKMLESVGYAVDVAYDADQAGRLLAQGGYVAMTLDLQLPGKDGLTLIRELRQLEATAVLPMLVVSATASQVRQEIGAEAVGIVGWLDKPVNQDQLLAALNRLLNVTGSARIKVLHVEDDADVFHVVSGVLRDVAETTQAVSLSVAQDLLAQDSYDLVILDLDLAGHSSMGLLPQLKQTKPKIPVVVFSASDVGTESVKQADAVLLKSRTDNDQLLATVKRLTGIL